jgi:hypothetical protein
VERGAQLKTASKVILRLGLSLAILPTLAHADPPDADQVNTPVSACASHPVATGKSPQRFDAGSLMVVSAELESQGEANFHLNYTAPTNECLVEPFSIGDVRVQARYSPWEKGGSTLLYRFVIERPDGIGEVLVLYSGTAGFISKRGNVFHVSEERGGLISWYAMFKEEPTYAAIRTLVEQIITGSAKPLMAVRWPKGAKEAEIVAFDNKRLK